jgi:hypothetical protein
VFPDDHISILKVSISSIRMLIESSYELLCAVMERKASQGGILTVGRFVEKPGTSPVCTCLGIKQRFDTPICASSLAELYDTIRRGRGEWTVDVVLYDAEDNPHRYRIPRDAELAAARGETAAEAARARGGAPPDARLREQAEREVQGLCAETDRLQVLVHSFQVHRAGRVTAHCGEPVSILTAGPDWISTAL